MKIGELFAGYGGLGMGVAQAIPGARPVWFSEFDEAPSRVLAERFPGVPNHGDITAIDWATVEPIDILTGGFPCQDLSQAGRRAGMRPGTRSGLWSDFLTAIRELRPGLVVIENVRGLLNGCAESDLESCPGCVGDGEHRPVLRALGRVLGDLAGLGFDAEWAGVRAADVGACHGRFRVFVLAWPADSDGAGLERLRRLVAAECAPHGLGNGSARSGPRPEARADAERVEHERRGEPRVVVGETGTRQGDGRERQRHGHAARDLGADAPVTLMPTPRVSDMKGPGLHGRGGMDLRTAVQLLPTPDAYAGERGGPQDPAKRRAGGHSVTVQDVVSTFPLLPTPAVADVQGGRKHRSGARNGELLLNGIAAADRFGDYADAIVRAEIASGHPAPSPRDDNGRLSARFVEWMMMLPEGHVDIEGVSRPGQLKMLGNGVVPAQAAHAVTGLLRRATEGTSPVEWWAA